jgi:hypothetical protein
MGSRASPRQIWQNAHLIGPIAKIERKQRIFTAEGGHAKALAATVLAWCPTLATRNLPLRNGARLAVCDDHSPRT